MVEKNKVDKSSISKKISTKNLPINDWKRMEEEIVKGALDELEVSK
ncbi:MAG: hypothetical protein ACE5J5_04030 [Candidatus Hydrothermarchaeales archaeon]